MVAFLWFFLEKTRQQVEEQFQEEQPIKEQYKELYNLGRVIAEKTI